MHGSAKNMMISRYIPASSISFLLQSPCAQNDSQVGPSRSSYDRHHGFKASFLRFINRESSSLVPVLFQQLHLLPNPPSIHCNRLHKHIAQRQSNSRPLHITQIGLLHQNQHRLNLEQIPHEFPRKGPEFKCELLLLDFQI